MRSQTYFVIEDKLSFSIPPTPYVKKGYYNTNAFQLSTGANLYWRDIYLGLNCSNCLSEGFSLPAFDRTGFDKINSTIWFFQTGYSKDFNTIYNLKIDGLIKTNYPSFQNISFSNIFKNKFSIGTSIQSGDFIYFVYYAGIKWKKLLVICCLSAG